MFVHQYMNSPAITIPPESNIQEALHLMRKQRIRRLPVVDAQGKLVGIVSERDLLYASPSPATSLSIWELNYLVSKLQVQEVMKYNPYHVSADSPLREAAQLMLTHKFGGLPVVDDTMQVIGIITESDIFRAFLETQA